MRLEDEFDDLLREVGREHRAIEPPERLEPALLAKMRELQVNAKREQSTAMARRAWAWGAAAVLAGLAVWGTIVWRSHSWKSPEATIKATPHELQNRTPRADAHAAVEQVIQPAHRDVDQMQERRRAVHETAHEVALAAHTGSLDVFIPLPTSEGLPPANQLSLVRVTLTGSDLQQYGLQAPPDAAARSLLAEFVVGEDGLPRAIRIVQ
ncbi:hypothetical protein ACFPT7_11140 [Acidicapsa dinghuensis]|uniref:Anti-sigma factor n=1 Tax=Acidicapsa dinghuensis TaxID=2218256 RepID=A0ABW1EFG5_9BACT|nr:hypothetical protein [Acidicapsa dinghuensis]